ncbi:UNVERIFIED_CONTAM: hypothetical protein FKN15_056747 [Acipenser sinensis]
MGRKSCKKQQKRQQLQQQQRKRWWSRVPSPFGPPNWAAEQELWRMEGAPMCGAYDKLGHEKEDCPYVDPQYEEAWNQGLVGYAAEWFWAVDDAVVSSTQEGGVRCGEFGHTVAICPSHYTERWADVPEEEKEWCTNCMHYGHEEHHCLEVFKDTLEWEEPEHPMPEWEEPVRPQAKKGKPSGPQPKPAPAEEECLLVPPPAPEEISRAALLRTIEASCCCHICGEHGHFLYNCPLPPEKGLLCPPPPAERECLLVPPPPAEGECLLVSPPPPGKDYLPLPPQPAEEECLLVPPQPQGESLPAPCP